MVSTVMCVSGLHAVVGRLATLKADYDITAKVIQFPEQSNLLAA